MSEEIVDAVRAAYEQFAQGDFSAYADLPDEFVLVTDPGMPDAGSYRGAAASRWLNAWVESFERLTIEAIDFIDIGDQVLVEFIQRGWPRGSDDAAVELRSWALMTVHDGALLRTELFRMRDQAFEAAGLADESDVR